MISEELIIEGCKSQNGIAQKALYNKFAPMMRAICMRYSANYEEAKDVLQEGFIKVFSHIHKFENKGSLEGWVKRIMINTAINFFKKHKKNNSQARFDPNESVSNNGEFETIGDSASMGEMDNYTTVVNADFTNEELMQALQILPPISRMIFNMFFIDELKHKDIGLALGIDENTSRIRLMRARVSVQKHLYELSLKKLAIS